MLTIFFENLAKVLVIIGMQCHLTARAELFYDWVREELQTALLFILQLLFKAAMLATVGQNARQGLV